MPSARSATAASRSRPGTVPRRSPRVISRSSKLRVRWERVGRIVLLLVFGVVVALYVEHTLSYFSTRAQTDQEQAIVRSLSRQNARLTREQKSLNEPSTIISDARALGMVRPGEQPYVVMGFAGH